jgi:hypothetical protein
MVILNASDPNTAKKMNDIINDTKHVFILVYMIGCGPCNATRPEWKKMCQSLENKYSSDGDVAILDLDSKFMNEVKQMGDVSGFPTMKYIGNNGTTVESYEDSNIQDKKRSSDSFIDWIESKVSSPTVNKSNSNISVNELSQLISSTQPNSAKTMENNKLTRKIKRNTRYKKSKSTKNRNRNRNRNRNKNRYKKSKSTRNRNKNRQTKTRK